jgi:hypothetical protein
MEWVERKLPIFIRASQNMAATAALLDVFPKPSTDGVGDMYQWLKDILDIAVAQEAESSQHRRGGQHVLELFAHPIVSSVHL